MEGRLRPSGSDPSTPPAAVSQGLFFRLLSLYSLMAAIFCFGIQLPLRHLRSLKVSPPFSFTRGKKGIFLLCVCESSINNVKCL